MTIEQKVNIHNRFDIHIDNIETGEHTEFNGVAFNIVLDQMFSRLCAASLGHMYSIRFGSGSGVLLPTRTTLFNDLGGKSAVDDTVVYAYPTSSRKRKIVLNPEEYVGATITEVGLCYSGSVGGQVTHAMLKDAEGNPISITKTSTDVVTIYATLYATIVETPGITFIGEPQNNELIKYLLDVSTSLTSTLELRESVFGAVNLGTANGGFVSDIPNKKRKTNVARFGITVGNGHAGSIGTAWFRIPIENIPGFSGVSYSNVPLATGDGVKKRFTLPSLNVDIDSVVIKVNSVVETPSKRKVKGFNFRYENTLPQDYTTGCAISNNGIAAIATMYGAPSSSLLKKKVDGSFKKLYNMSLPASGYNLEISDDGKVLVASEGNSPYINVYEIGDTGYTKLANPVSLLGSYGNFCDVSGDGKVCAVSGSSASRVAVYDIVDHVLVRRAQPPSMRAGNPINVRLSYDGNIMSLLYDSKIVDIYEWNGTAWTLIRTFTSTLPSVFTLAVNDDATILTIAGNSSPFIQIVEWVTSEWINRSVQTGLAAIKTYINNLNMTNDGKYIVWAQTAAPNFYMLERVGDEYLIISSNRETVSSTYGINISSDGNNVIMCFDRYSGGVVNTDPNAIEIDFPSPVSVGAAITADYTVNGVHKTDQYVIDASFAVAFAEGV